MENEKRRKINADATREMIRSRYGTVTNFALDAGILQRTLNYALAEKLGTGRRNRGENKGTTVIRRLRDEGLLVEEEVA